MKKYRLEGLDCAKCAARIEEEVRNQEGVKFVSVNFSTSQLIIDAERTDEVIEAIKRVAPDVRILDAEEEDEEEEDVKKEVILVGVSALLFSFGIIEGESLHSYPLLEYAIFLSAYLLSGGKIIWKAVKNVTGRALFDENFLLTVATLGAIAIHELPEAVAVMLFFRVGEILEDHAVGKSRRSIKALLEIKPTFANLKINGEIRRVKPEEVKPGDIIIVRPGEKIPLDGIVVEGNSAVDVSSLTGESKPRNVSKGGEVLSGMVNMSSLLTIKVTKPFTDSTVSRILQLVEEAGGRKAKVEKFITKFARYYTPAVILIAISLAVLPPLLLEEPFKPWIYKALVLLVISCPCALVVSLPLSYFASIGKAAKNGILVKGANFLEALSSAKIVAFDKTGTLTKGSFQVSRVSPRNGFTEEELLRFAAIAELNSTHPIARSIVEEYRKRDGELTEEVREYREIPGRGVIAELEDMRIIAGNDAMMHEMGIEHDGCDVVETAVYVAINGKYAGYIVLEDEPKEDARKAVEELKKLNCEVLMLTGDNRETASRVASTLGIKKYYAELLPEDKVRIIEELKERDGGTVVFVGDGMNDAPVIARADVGISMGAMGSDAAIEIADVVVMDDRPSKVPEAIRISKRTQKISWENIIFILGVKGIFVSLGAVGMATMWEAVFADVGVTLLAILNALRLLR
ncbi:MAG: cadmium-translocating P-type ATPase [Archaeoglobi archaeon]|nr:cadmium-translocating P-type ATPase [Candidatus Mnemosynella bozhongmuii]